MGLFAAIGGNLAHIKDHRHKSKYVLSYLIFFLFCPGGSASIVYPGPLGISIDSIFGNTYAVGCGSSIEPKWAEPSVR